jgi:GTP-binding protein
MLRIVRRLSSTTVTGPAAKYAYLNDTIRTHSPTLYRYDPESDIPKLSFDADGNVIQEVKDKPERKTNSEEVTSGLFIVDEDEELQRDQGDEPNTITSRWTQGRTPVNQTKQHLSGNRTRTIKFMDRVVGEARGGNGGKGTVSFGIPKRTKAKSSMRMKIGSPDGGNGGSGGDVIIKASSSVQTLDMRTFNWNGGHGTNGSGKKSHGKHGGNCVLHVPCGTVVRVTPRAEVGFQHYYNQISFDQFFKDSESEKLKTHSKTGRPVDERKSAKKQEEDDAYESEEDSRVFPMMTKEYDLLKENDFVIVAQGGRGGVGNAIRKSIPHTTRERSIPGMRGDVVKLELELKCIADVGLVGMPNAGKSSLTTAISSASPKVAAYPFTTLMPFVGVVRLNDKKGLHKSLREDFERKFTVADIPGIIEGASDGKGLGLAFLRHVERTKLLLYVIDIVGSEGRDPVEDFLTLSNEVSLYRNRNQEVLAHKPAMIFANKMDVDPDLAMKNAARLSDITDLPVYVGSAKKGLELGHLVHDVFKLLNLSAPVEEEEPEEIII